MHPSRRSVLPILLSAVIAGASFVEATRTLNLKPDRVFGVDLVRWVESRLRQAVGEPADPGLGPVDPEAVPAS